MHRYNKKPIEIGRLQRFAMDAFYEAGAILPVASARNRGGKVEQRVACVGGGPASLACAAELRRQGFPVTVFDDRPMLGGLNTYGVAEYKLRPSDSLREVALVQSLGVEFRKAEVGESVCLDELERDYSFIFLGLGLGSMERLGIPGEQAVGVIDALRFIERYKTLPGFSVGKIVVVIGGGNTAIDAANAARRLGAQEVHIFYRRTENEMPAFSFEYEHSKVEGVHFHWNAQPVAIIERDGRAVGVKFVRTTLGEPDATGRRKAEPVPRSEFDFACGMVIPALGQSRVTKLLQGTRGIDLKGGLIAVDRLTGRTGNEKYYAGGDCVNGGREVVDAVADGKRAAFAMAAQMDAQHG